MKLMVVGDVFGSFHVLKKDVDFIDADAILICGNVGIKYDTMFMDYWEGRLPIDKPIRFITGKHEDFGLVKEVVKTANLKRPDIFPVDSWGKCKLGDIKLAGVSGTYSEKYYIEETIPNRHMRKSSMESVPKECDIVLLHNVPGKLGKRSGIDFDMEFFDFLKEKQARYVFVGGYGLPKFSCFPFGVSTVLFLPPLDKGYAIIDTDSWSCYFNNKMDK